jgi:WD40 repeat protein
MKDKNLLAEKLNQMNDLEQSLLDKEKEIRAEKFYLQKQWEEFDEAQKNVKNTPTPKPTASKM